MPIRIEKKLIKFEWDRGNLDKSQSKHGITPKEAEEVFIDEASIVLPDLKHSQSEDRFIIIGRSLGKLNLFIVFTFREDRIRVISVRKMHRKEVLRYEKIKKNTKI